MGRVLRQIAFQLRWQVPVWFVGLLTNWMPDNRVTARLRGLLLRPFIARCGRNFQVGSGVVLRETDRLTVGRDVYIARGCWIDCSGGLTIDDEVMFGPYVVLSTATHVFQGGSARHAGVVVKPVRIGRGSWLAAHVGVAGGVTIGSGVLVAGNAFVSGDIPDGVVAGGVPARVLRPNTDQEPDYRFRSERLAK